MNIEKTSTDVVTMDEAVEGAVDPDQHNEQAIGKHKDN